MDRRIVPLLVGVAFLVVLPSSTVRHLLASLVVAGTVLLVIVATRRLVVVSPWWRCAAAGFVISGVIQAGERGAGVYPESSVRVAEFGYAVTFVFLVIGLLGLARERCLDRWTGLSISLEAVAIGSATAMLAWLLVLEPALEDDAANAAVAVFFSLAGLMLLVFSVRLAIASQRNASARWIVAGTAVLVTTDLTYLAGASVSDIATGWVAACVCFAAAASHRDLPGLFGPAPARREGPAQLWTLAPAVAALPVAMVLSTALDRPLVWPVVGLASVSTLAVLSRMATLLLDHRSANVELEGLAGQDPLTGLVNRRQLRARLDAAVSGSDPVGFSVVHFIDLDGFKEINDRYGHAAGDEVLRECGSRLLGVVRSDDVVCRYAGDEFVVACAHRGAGAAVGTVADRIVEALEEPIALGGETVAVGASIGSVAFDPTRSVDDLLDEADRRMYQQKLTRRRASSE